MGEEVAALAVQCRGSEQKGKQALLRGAYSVAYYRLPMTWHPEGNVRESVSVGKGEL